MSVRNKSTRVLVKGNILFEKGSQSSYISSSLYERLKLEVIETKYLKISVFMDNSDSGSEYKVVELELLGVDCSKLGKVVVVPSIAKVSQTVSLSTTELDVSLCGLDKNCGLSVDVWIVIGNWVFKK